MGAIFNEMEVALPMQRISTLKRNRQRQAQLPEYQKKDIHRVIVTANSDSANLMQIKSDISGKVYSINLEFTDGSTGIGEEIRDTLKEKYLQRELESESGSLQREPSALQSSTPVGETEVQDA